MKIENILSNFPEVIKFYLEELSNFAIVLIDKDKKILDCNKGFLEILGFKEKPLKINIEKLLSKSSENLTLPKNSFIKINLLFIAKNDVEILLKGYIFPLKDCYLIICEQLRLTYNEIIQKMSQLNDQIVNMTRELEKKNIQLKEAINKISRIMNTDHLTGLLNRRAFEKIIKREISFALRHNMPLSLAMIDIDHFKKINDTFGHEIGDLVLKVFAKTLEKSIRHDDFLGRFGGEEFVLLLPNTNIEQSFHASERIRQKIEKLKIKEIKGNITASFGITELLPTDDDKDFIKRADDALYEAKRKGRNCCAIK